MRHFAHVFRPFAAVLLCLVALAPIDARAQLRGVGGVGGAGNIGGLPGAPPVPNIGGLPGGGSGPLTIPNVASPPVGAGQLPTDAVSSGVPRVDAGVPQNITRPTDTVTNTLSGSVRNTLSAPREVSRSLANTTNQAVRNAVRTNPAIQAQRSGVPPVGERRFVSDEVMVSLPANTSPQALDALARQHNLTLIETQRIGLTGTTFYRWRVADGRSVSDVIRALEAQANVAQPNYRFVMQEQTANRAPADGPDPAQYASAKLALPQAHRLATGEKILVAVIDSGIDATHPEIAGRIAANFDALDSREPAHSHGTAMAGAIVAHARLLGAAPGAHLLAIRAFGASGSGAEGTTLTLLKAIDWAVAHGARVINMSFAGPTDPELARALTAAHKRGVVLVAAAGNAGAKSPPLFPASDGNVIAVTATDVSDKLLTVAVRGRHIAVAAPGVDILGPVPNASYALSSGTSVAAAQVSGIVALLLERKPNLTPDAVKTIMLASATDLGPKGRDDQFGAGLANALRALQSLDADIAQPKAANVSAAR